MNHVSDSRRIKRSRAKCLRCQEIIESKHRHDYQTCKCSNAVLDGGQAYVRWGMVWPDSVELMTDYAEVKSDA